MGFWISLLLGVLEMAAILFLILVITGVSSPAFGKISYNYFLDSFNIDSKWVRGKDCNIYSGEHQEKKHSIKNITYCSLFVAHVARKLNIYLPAPPIYKRYFLASTQCRWLLEKGTSYEWKKVSPLQAQDNANKKYFTLVCTISPRGDKPGHIAIVRPTLKTSAKLLEEGPEILNVGWHNQQSVSVKKGFKKQKNAFEEGRIYYFSYLKEKFNEEIIK